MIKCVVCGKVVNTSVNGKMMPHSHPGRLYPRMCEGTKSYNKAISEKKEAEKA